MNRVTRSSVALAALSLASIVTFASKASAGTASLTVSTTVPTSCTFDAASKVNGILGQDFANNTLDSTFTGGSAATVDLTCNNAGSKLALTSATLIEPSAAATANRSSMLVTVTHPDSVTPITYDGTTTDAPVSITSLTQTKTVTVNAKAIYNAGIEAGAYTFTVNLTANP